MVDALLLELGGLDGAPPPPVPTKRDVPLMGPGDVVLLDMNGEKRAFVNLKKNQCVLLRSAFPLTTLRLAFSPNLRAPSPR